MKRMLIAIFLTAAVLAISGCGKEDLAPNQLSNLATCTDIELDQCTENLDVIPADSPVIYATAKLDNATYGVKASCVLRYLDGDSEDVINVDFTVDVVTESLSSYLVFYFTNDEPWAAGEYEVTVSTETPDSRPVSKTFRFE